MKRSDIKKAFGNIEPDEVAMQRMLNNVLNHFDKKDEEGQVNFMKNYMKSLNMKKAIPVFSMAIVVAGSIIVYSLFQYGIFGGNASYDKSPEGNNTENYVAAGSSTKDSNIDDGITGKNAESIDAASENGGAGKSGSGSGDSRQNAPAEDMIARITNQFQMDNKHYIILSESQKLEFKIKDDIDESDIGKKIATITTSVDESLIGSEVYEYLPAGCDAVVAVKTNNEYRLFKFFNFESYNNNQDEDTSAYLKLYGINSASDIAKIQFIGYSEQAKLEGKVDIIAEITDAARISKFYSFYSVIKNSSGKYFEKLFNYRMPGYEKETGEGQDFDGGQIVNPDQGISREIMPVPPEVISQPAYPGGYSTGAGYVPRDYAQQANDLAMNEVSKAEADVAGVLPPDAPVSSNSPIMDMGNGNSAEGNETSTTEDRAISGSGSTGSSGSSSGSVPGYPGYAAGALSNSMTIRIYNQHGVYMSAEYYPNIGFISRHEVNEEFAAFLRELTAR